MGIARKLSTRVNVGAGESHGNFASLAGGRSSKNKERNLHDPNIETILDYPTSAFQS